MTQWELDRDRQGRADGRDTEGGNWNRTAGVVGKVGRDETVVDWYDWRGGDGDTEGRKYQQMIYVSWVYVVVWTFIWGVVGAKDRGWYV